MERGLSVSRRRLLGFAAGAAAGTAVGVPAGRTLGDFLQATNLPVYPPRGPESFVLAVCNLCPGGCGLRVRRIGERAVKVDGNPLHPVNGGRLCPRGQAALQSLYHPDRFGGPLRRVGPRGLLSSFQRVSWDRALDEVAARLTPLREQGRPESLVLLRGGSQRLGSRLAQRFLAAFGSPNDVTLERGEFSASLALQLGQGVLAAPAYDLSSADYLLSLGGAVLEAWSSPVHTMRAIRPLPAGTDRPSRQARPGRATSVHHGGLGRPVDRRSAGDRGGLRPRSGGGHRCRGVVRQGIRRGTHRRARGRVGPGGEQRRGLRSLLEREYPLERVAEETGVSANVILRVARECAAARRGVAVGPRRGPLLPGSLHGHLVAQTLNALLGSIDSEGGVLIAEETPLAPWPALPEDAVARRGRGRPRLDGAGTGDFPSLPSDPERLAEAILARSPYPVEALLDSRGGSGLRLLRARPVRGGPREDPPGRLVCDTCPTTRRSTPTGFCRRRISWSNGSSRRRRKACPIRSSVSRNRRCHRPLHDVRPVSEVFLELARRCGNRSRCGVSVEGRAGPYCGPRWRASTSRSAGRSWAPPSTKRGCA